VRDLPHVSVDIDLTYLPLKPRDDALQEIQATLWSLKKDIEQHVPESMAREFRSEEHIVKLLVSTPEATVKIEPNLIIRGSVYATEERDLCVRPHSIISAPLQASRRYPWPIYEDQFIGMTRIEVSLDDLLEVQRNLAGIIVRGLTMRRRSFSCQSNAANRNGSCWKSII